jgi:hypothetical protein
LKAGIDDGAQATYRLSRCRSARAMAAAGASLEAA